MTVGRALIDGWGRVWRAPWLVVSLWAMTVLLALPLALTLRGMLAGHLGASLAAERAAAGVDFDWWNEFLAQAAGIGHTFVPSILGFAAVIRNVSDLADARGLPTVIAAAVVAHMVLSTFVLGGVLDRLARNRRVGGYGFFSACGLYFSRFLRLAALAGAVYWLLFTRLHPWLFDTVFDRLTRDLAVERTAFLYRTALYAAFGAVVLLINVTLDYAKIRIVVEDRRSALGAVVAALRFMRRQPGAVLAVYLVNALLFIAVAGLYAAAAPDVGGGGVALLAFAIGQAYIAGRVAVRLMFAGSQIALFQGRLAHAGYIATPTPAWADSPAVEAIGPATRD